VPVRLPAAADALKAHHAEAVAKHNGIKAGRFSFTTLIGESTRI